MNILTAMVSLLLMARSYGHEWGWGSCSSVTPVMDFDVDKFMGLWYVIEQFDTTSTCLTFNYTRLSETQLSVAKHRQFYLLDKMGMDHTETYVGTLDIPYRSQPAMLRVKWPLNVAGKGDYVVFSTDYSTYAGIYDCQQITFFAFRESAAILSRTQTLSKSIINKMKNNLSTFKVDVEEFSKVDHSTCRREEADYKIKVDKNTLKNYFYDAVDSVKVAANKVSETASDAVQYAVDTYDSISRK